MKKSVVLLTTTSMLLSAPTWAHRTWIKPDTTVVSKEDSWVAFDAAISNEIFGFDHHAMRLDRVKAIAPNGEQIPLQHTHTGKYRSVFDLQLSQQGTYKVAFNSESLRASWTNPEGEKKYWPGRGEIGSLSEFEKQVPKDAANLIVSNVYNRVETFVTAGAPTNTVLEETGKGVELVPITHPNDLYAGEQAQFKIHLNGQPAIGAEVEVIPAGMRYRDQQNEITTRSDSEGVISITWPHAGQYFMEVRYSDMQGEYPAEKRQAGYSAVFEVL